LGRGVDMDCSSEVSGAVELSSAAHAQQFNVAWR